MFGSLTLAAIAVCSLRYVVGQQQAVHGGQHGGQHAEQHGSFGAQNEVHNQEHIKQHLEGQINVDESKMTEEQLQFHYFKMYDTDNNSMLDGIEIIKAITHFHNEEDPNNPGKVNRFTEKELEDMVDPILKDEDINQDGYIDYIEFVKSQERAKHAGAPSGR